MNQDWNLRKISRNAGLLFGLFVVVSLVAFVAFRYSQEVKKLTQENNEKVEKESMEAKPTPFRILPDKFKGSLDKAITLKEGDIPTLEQMEMCPNGFFPDGPAIPQQSREQGYIYGLIEEKQEGIEGSYIVKVREVLDDRVVEADLSNIDRIDFRGVIDREQYYSGNRSAFRHILIEKGEPYTIDNIFPYLSVGTHIWLRSRDVYGKEIQVLLIYCDIE